MNCYHFILIVFILFLLWLEICCFSNKENEEASNDFSNEEKKEVQKKFMFSPEKRGERLFLYFIYLFPLIISAIRPGESGFNIFESIKSNMSFYATALTITFAVYSFLKTQNATEDERIEREKQREDERIERENQRDEERKERENKDFELREKELEAKRDYYRPIFVIEQIEENKKQVRLLMKDDTLYLEHIVFYKYINKGNYIREDEQQLKSNEIINGEVDGSFYITAKTLLGENILFYYFYRDRKKHYFYLKPNNQPIEPLDGKAVEYTPSNINKIWGSYNNLYSLEEKEKHKYDMSNILNDAFPIRINLATNNSKVGFRVYGACYLDGIFNNIFAYIKYLTIFKGYDERLYTLLINLITILEKIIDSIYFNIDKINFNKFIEELESDTTAKNNKTSNNDRYIEQFLETVKRYLGDSTYIDGISNGDNDEVIKPVNFLNIIKNSLKESRSSDYKNFDKILLILCITFFYKIIIFDTDIKNNDQLVDQAKHYLLDYENYFKD